MTSRKGDRAEGDRGEGDRGEGDRGEGKKREEEGDKGHKREVQEKVSASVFSNDIGGVLNS